MSIEYTALRQFLKLLLDEDDNLNAVFHEAFAELTPRQRQLTELYYIRQLDMRQIAKKLDVNISTVSRTLARAKVHLLRCLRFGKHELLEKVRDKMGY